MMHLLILASLMPMGPVKATPSIAGQYVEARNCDIWTGPCFANSEMNLTGKHAVVGWKIDRGSKAGVKLDGLSVVAVISASDTLGLKQTAPSKAMLIVDSRATPAQREALVAVAREQGGDLLKDVIAIQSAKVDMEVIQCKEGGCARLEAGKAKIETRCLDGHDKVCGNESAFYPPLTKNVNAAAAMAVEHSFTGKSFNETWNDAERRGAYVGKFEIK
ncbi:hypothetical protein BH10PLA2_BH10PLA2_36800 [soil metagenome]